MNTKLKSVLFFFLEIVQIVAIALIIVVPIRYFVFQPFVVQGASMEPNFHDGDYLVVDELSYRLRDPRRGEVVVFKFPQDETKRFIKRIIGLPGERVTISDNHIGILSPDGQTLLLDESIYLPIPVLLNNNNLVLKQDEYFVMGDNRLHSYDSRVWGSVKREEIIGRVLVRAWPFTDLSLIPTPSY